MYKYFLEWSTETFGFEIDFVTIEANYPNFMLKPDQKLQQKILSLNITKIP